MNAYALAAHNEAENNDFGLRALGQPVFSETGNFLRYETQQSVRECHCERLKALCNLSN